MCHVNDCLIKPGLMFQAVLVSLKHLSRSAAAEGKGRDRGTQRSRGTSQKRWSWRASLCLLPIKPNAGGAHEVQVLTGHGQDGIWRHSWGQGAEGRAREPVMSNSW